MRIGVIPSNPLEHLILALGLAPTPMLDSQVAFTMARVIMAGVELGIFEALDQGPLGANEIADRRSLDRRATTALLAALVGCDYLAYDAASERYALRPVARRWLLRSSEQTLTNKMLFHKHEWEMLGRLEEFVRTGTPLDFHGNGKTEAEWSAYQLAMADIGRISLPEVVRRTPIPRGATAMLDIGGAGGTYSAAFVKSHPGLSSLVLDLPAAVAHARPLVEAYGLGDRLQINAGNVLEADLGQARFDFVFMANVAHHLSAEQNSAVARKAHAALRPGGVMCILDVERTRTPSPKNQLGGLLDLYYSMTSRSGTWSIDEMAGWLSQAGFAAGKPVRLRTTPGVAEVWGTRR